MIYTVTLNPALDKTVQIPNMTVNAVHRITEMRTDPGGKGINVSKVLAKLGGESTVLALLGGSTGHQIAAALEALGLKCQLTFAPGETRTNLKIVDPILHTNTDLNEPGMEAKEAVLNRMLAELTAMVKPGDIVVISGSLPMGAPKDTYFHWVAECKKAGAKVFLDVDGARMAEAVKAVPYLVKPNQEELSNWVGRHLETVEDMIAAAKELLAIGIEKVVVSMGSKGALYVTGETVIRANGLKVPVGSTVGAGDSVVAALAYAEERNLCQEKTVCLFTAAGAANVMCSGSQAAEYEVIEALLDKVEYTWL